MKVLRSVVAVSIAGSILAACAGGQGSASTSTSASTPLSTTSTSTSASTSASSVSLTLTALSGSANTGFVEKTLSAPADTEFTITLDNQDAGIPHNVQIFSGSSATGTPVFAPEDNGLITGPAKVTYEISALPAGTYTFDCFVHPALMVGTLTVS
jgi:Copper binding proteins, plastocyanin/azurin family.